ncbi:MAG TPA: hypothetical protein VK427_19455 [Kofleriaceae bacterium]|nr:hypothetical protein [Kofleriaceae bacterium]
MTKLVSTLVLTACTSTTPLATMSPEAPSGMATPPGYTLARTGDLHDFDFIEGGWTVANRRLDKRGVGSTRWEEFPATICGKVYLGGVANVDELVFPTKGWAGLTVRTFDRAKRQWSIYWISSRTGTMFPPVHGGFTGDRGEFYGTDDDDGRPVYVRFVWTKQGPDRATWEQAFSFDGKTWEVNWQNTLTRAPSCT